MFGKGGLGFGPEGLSKVSYTLQRQTIFNISLMKLYSQRPLGEPSLERRVLINNMLRRIQDELKQEAAATAQVSQPSTLLMPVIAPPPSPHPMVPPNCQANQACPGRVEACPAPLEACLTPASLLEEDGGDSTFCVPSPPTPPLSPPPVHDGFPSTLSDMELGPPTAITRTAAANTTTVTTSPAPTLVDSSCPSSPPSSASPSGFLSDLALDDVLFADIDTSMYDFDPCMTTGTVGVTAGGSLTKLSPVVTTDDLLKSLASPYSSSAPQVSANQPFKIDLTELDHIMEVLVGS
uniref:SERTA domain containing 2b n=1 Tax=Lates calcarifer TaxID=8187 RepID=A0A4W6BY57_LATCA